MGFLMVCGHYRFMSLTQHAYFNLITLTPKNTTVQISQPHNGPWVCMDREMDGGDNSMADAFGKSLGI